MIFLRRPLIVIACTAILLVALFVAGTQARDGGIYVSPDEPGQWHQTGEIIDSAGTVVAIQEVGVEMEENPTSTPERQ